MAGILKKITRRALRFTLWAMATVLVLIVVLQIGLMIGLNYLMAGKATAFAQAQIKSLIAGSGYDVSFAQMTYDPARGITLKNLSVSDPEGEFLTLDQFSAGFSWSKIFLHTLEIEAHGGRLVLLRVPEPSQKKALASQPLQAFTLPQSYIRTLLIKRFSLDQVDVRQAALVFSPNLTGTIGLSDQVQANLNLETGFDPVLNFPAEIKLRGSFTPQTLEVLLDDLQVTSPVYSLTGQGKGTLTEAGRLDYRFSAAARDISVLSQNLLQSAEADISLSGNYHAPVIDITGKAIPGDFKTKGLGDITFMAHLNELQENMRGDLGIQTTYKEMPVSATANFALASEVLHVEALKLVAPAIEATGNLDIALGSGLVSGQIEYAASDLSMYKDLAGIDLKGALKGQLHLKGASAAQAVDLEAELQNGQTGDLKVENLKLKAGISDVKFLWPENAAVEITNFRAGESLSLKKMTASVKRSAEEAYKLTLDGVGTSPAPVAIKGTADLTNLSSVIPTVRNMDFTATLGKSVVKLSGDVDAEKVALHASADQFRLNDLPLTFPDALAGARLNADLSVTGSVVTPVSVAAVTLQGINGVKYKGLVLQANAKHEANILAANLSGKGPGIRSLTADIKIPLQFSLSPFVFVLNETATFTGNFQSDLDIAPLAMLIIPPSQELTGTLKAQGSLGGSIKEPVVKGTANLLNGHFTDETNGILLAGITANAVFVQDAVSVTSLQATDGENGRLSGNGSIAFGAAPKTNLSVDLHKFHLPKSDLANGLLSAELTLKDAADGYQALGTVNILQMNVTIPESFQTKIPELNIVERRQGTKTSASTVPIGLAIKIDAPNQVFVRGWGLDAEFGGALDISGTAQTPLINGELSSKRGRYEEFGKRFTLAKANLRFQGEVPPSPYLDVEATTPADDVTASILLTGPVKKPVIAFSSTPALPQDEVLSRILFGRTTARITPFQAVQLAQTLQRFSGKGGGGFDPLGQLRSVTGLDDISVDTDASGQTNVGVGKYLTDKVYLEFEKGKAENSGAANIQIEVSPSVNIQSKIGQDAKTGGGVFWKKDY